MSQTSDNSSDTTSNAANEPATVERVVVESKPNRLYQAAAWVAIVAGVTFIVGSIFFSGFFLGKHSGGPRHFGPGMMGPGMMMEREGGPGMHRMDPVGPGWPGRGDGDEGPGGREHGGEGPGGREHGGPGQVPPTVAPPR